MRELRWTGRPWNVRQTGSWVTAYPAVGHLHQGELHHRSLTQAGIKVLMIERALRKEDQGHPKKQELQARLGVNTGRPRIIAGKERIKEMKRILIEMIMLFV